MAPPKKKVGAAGTRPGADEIKKTDKPLDYTDPKPKASKWREHFKVHPAADVFPMMSDEELEKLGEDLKANGLKHSPMKDRDGLLLDGRNRLEAMERAGMGGVIESVLTYHGDNPAVTYIISANIRRRHLTKQQRSDLIVAAIKAGQKLDQVEPVSKGGRGKVSQLKKAAVEEAKKHDIGESTVKRSLAKVNSTPGDPKTPFKPETEVWRDPETGREFLAGMAPRKPKPKKEKTPTGFFNVAPGIEAARKHYLQTCEADDGVDLDAERELVVDGLKEIMGRQLMEAGDPGDIPECLRRPQH